MSLRGGEGWVVKPDSVWPLYRLAVALALLATLPARAQTAATGTDDYINPDRPGIADGSNVVGAGRFEVETGLQREYRSDDAVQDQTLFAPTLLRLGLSGNWEARIESNVYTWVSSFDPAQGSTHREGASPISIGAKYHFLDSAGVRQPSMGAILRIFPPSGTGSFGSAHATGDFRLAADWDFAPRWSLNPNLGVGVYEGDARRLYTAALFAATLNFNPNKILNLFVDAAIQSPETNGGATSIVYDGGVACLIGRDIQLDVSLGTGAAGATPPHPFLAAGISKRF